MQMNRLFEIVYILLSKNSITAKELSKRFEVSVRTIYRDIDTLSSVGIPIYTSQGKGGGIFLLDNYVLDKSILSENEQNEILFALQSLTITQASETSSVLAKLGNLFKKTQMNWIEVDFSPWGSDKSQKYKFSILKNAILHQQVIEFGYFNASGEKSIRKIEPVKLMFKVKAWYLQGFCLSKNAFRNFKISRMSDICITQETFTVKLPEEFSETVEIQSTQKWIEVCLKMSSHASYRLFDEFDEKDIIKNSDGSFSVRTFLPESEWLIRYILSFGADAEVVTPQNIRDKLQDELVKIGHKYKI